MKILIVEGNAVHRKAAVQQLTDHELTIMSSFTEFFKKIAHNHKNAFLPQFDMLLTDVKLPLLPERKNMAEAPTGFVVVLKGLEAGIKMIGILTEIDHYDISKKSLELWQDTEPFAVGEIKICIECFHSIFMAAKFDLAKKLVYGTPAYEEARKKGNLIPVKNWIWIVKKLSE